MSKSPRHRPRVTSPITLAFLTGVAWTGVAWTGVAWTGVAWTGMAWTGVAWTGICWTPAAHAAQSLIPLPYPGAVSGGEPLDPEPQGLGGPQRIMRDPYPQLLGDNAQGNPPIGRVHRHQHLVPGITRRKYRVDRTGY